MIHNDFFKYYYNYQTDTKQVLPALSLAEKIRIKYLPDGNKTSQYQYDQSDPFYVS